MKYVQDSSTSLFRLYMADGSYYGSDVDDLGSPMNVAKAKAYAYTVASGGNSIAPNEVPPGSVVTITDPTTAATLLRSSEITYLANDSNYSSVASYYSSQNISGLATVSKIKDGAGALVSQSEIVYDESGRSPGYRGNPTTAKAWYDVSNSNSYISTKAKFDSYGNRYESTDARGNTSTTTYDSTYYAFPIQVTSPIPGGNGSTTAFTSSAAFDTTTGLPTSTTDANAQTTTISYRDPITNVLDPLLRVRKVTAPNGQQTITEYGAGTDASTRWVKVKSQIDETNWKTAISWLDGLGRTYKSQAIDTNGDVFALTCFDTVGRPLKASNPFRDPTSANPTCSSTTLDWTANTYDTASRPWKVTTPDGAVVETTYGLATSGSQLGIVVTITDPAGKLRRSVTNALGQLGRVDEPDGSSSTGSLGSVSSPNQPTVYSYDALNNLTTVLQAGATTAQCGETASCSQTRTFTYDSLSRLKSAVNPESGTIGYTYDSNGNLATKTDARSVVTTFAYDTLNRIQTRDYTNEPSGQTTTPNVTYYYDNVANAKGKLVKVSSSVSTTEYISFDILGRVTGHKQTTDGNDYATAYLYNLGGAMTEEIYPSTRVVKNVLDNNGDLSIIQSKKNSASGYWNYANNFTYNSAGAVTSMQLGNGKWESTIFNSRLQPTQIALGTVQSGNDSLKLDYSYGTTANNGNILTQTMTVPTVGSYNGFTAIQSYAYDSLNRIDDAMETISGNQTWRQDFTYDRYGNRNFNQNTTTIPASFSNPAVSNPTISSTNNRLNSSGYGYDSSGNTQFDASLRKFTYDAESKQTKVESTNSSQQVTGTIGEYFYDGDGKRVKKYVLSTGETTIFVYDAVGKQIAEYSTIAADTANAKVAYLTNDQLGSPRINTDANGNVVSRHDYHPFGEELSTSQRSTHQEYADDTSRKGFTGYEHDGEINLNFAEARVYSSSLGRFSIPDPENTGADLTVPQSWNGYSYVINNPINYTDPSGLIYLRNPKGDGKIIWVDDRKYNPDDYKGYEVIPTGTIITPGEGSTGIFQPFIGIQIRLLFDGQLQQVSGAGDPVTVFADHGPIEPSPLHQMLAGAEHRTLRFWRLPIYVIGTAVVLLPAATPLAFGGGVPAIGLTIARPGMVMARFVGPVQKALIDIYLKTGHISAGLSRGAVAAVLELGKRALDTGTAAKTPASTLINTLEQMQRIDKLEKLIDVLK